MKNDCTARLLWCTLREAERRIGLCGDATRAPYQLPKWLRRAERSALPPQPFWPQSDKSSCPYPFKVCGRAIAQGRMQAFFVVHLSDKLGNRSLGFADVAVVIAIDLFVLQRFDKAFRHGVVVRITGPAHAAADAVLVEQITVVSASILYAAIGVMHQSRI